MFTMCLRHKIDAIVISVLTLGLCRKGKKEAHCLLTSIFRSQHVFGGGGGGRGGGRGGRGGGGGGGGGISNEKHHKIMM